MEIGYLQEVKAVIKSLVLSCPDSITVDALNRDYRSTEGMPIPYKKLGFQTLESFLRSISDTITVYGSGPTASVNIVRNEKSDHIHQMVCQQKKTRTRARGKPSRQRVVQNAFENSNNTRSGRENIHSVSNRYISDNLPTSNIRFSHSITRSTPRNIVNRCQPLELSSSFTAKKIARDAMLNSNEIQRNACLNTKFKNQTMEHSSIVIGENSQSSRCKSGLTKQDHQRQGIFEKFLEKCTIQDEDPILGPLTQSNKNIEKENLPLIKCPQKVPSKTTNINNRAIIDSKVFQVKKSLEEKQRIDDMEEAVPAYAADNLVFRMDFPDNAMKCGQKIPPYKLPDNVRLGSIVGIFISEIHSPFKFWFHIYKDHHELDSLMLQIERFYTTLEHEEFCIPPVCICPGQVCAALYKGLWHRAEILSPVINNKTKVLFVDYGTVSEVIVGNIKFLLTVFATLPKQAIRGSLSHIRPKNLHWCQESINYFLSMSCELMLYAQISEIYAEQRSVFMVLCDSNGSEVVQINKELIEKGFAVHDVEWQKSDKRGQRLHHLREDFPTFSMLEMGEYPSFAELVDLKNKGIDYEWIIDHNIYHPGRLNLNENVPEVIRKLPFQLLTTNPFRQDIYLQLQHLL